MHPEVVDRHAVQEDLAPGHVVEPHQQVDERGLASACVTDDGHLLAGVHSEAHVFQHQGRR